MSLAEFRLEPPEEPYIAADCGCEIYDGGKLYELEGKWLCADCFLERVVGLGADAVAEMIGSEIEEADFLSGRIRR